METRKYQIYFPEVGYEGVGFCWVAVHPSPDGLALAVEGCYWACPYELVITDFREPEILPYPELARFDALDGCDDWVDNNTIVIKREITIRKSDGATYESLSEKEREVLDNDLSLIDYRTESFTVQRPSF